MKTAFFLPKGISTLVLLFALMSISATTEVNSTIRFGLMKYSGGGDWYSNRDTSLPNLIKFCNKELGMDIGLEQVEVDVGSPELYNLPFVHMTGHGNVVFSDQEAENLRNYLIGGGFLHIDDNYGMEKFVRPAMKKVFPELEFVELPFSHEIYHQKFKFTNGLPKIHLHDNKQAQGFGIIHNGRVVCFMSIESDLGDGWENPEIHNDPPSVRQKALQMGANIVQFAFTQ